MEEKLTLNFTTGIGKRHSLTLNSPRSDILPEDIETVMNLIISKDVFGVEGGVSAIENAKIVTTEVQEFVFE